MHLRRLKEARNLNYVWPTITESAAKQTQGMWYFLGIVCAQPRQQTFGPVGIRALQLQVTAEPNICYKDTRAVL